MAPKHSSSMTSISPSKVAGKLSLMAQARALLAARESSAQDLQLVSQKLGIGSRKAHALARIAAIFDNRGIPDQRLEALGWAKLDLLGSHVADDGHNLIELIQLAEQKSQLELKALLQGQEVAEEYSSLLLHLPTPVAERFVKILITHGAIRKATGVVGKEEALARFLDAWEAENQPL